MKLCAIKLQLYTYMIVRKLVQNVMFEGAKERGGGCSETNTSPIISSEAPPLNPIPHGMCHAQSYADTLCIFASLAQ